MVVCLVVVFLATTASAVAPINLGGVSGYMHSWVVVLSDL